MIECYIGQGRTGQPAQHRAACPEGKATTWHPALQAGRHASSHAPSSSSHVCTLSRSRSECRPRKVLPQLRDLASLRSSTTSSAQKHSRHSMGSAAGTSAQQLMAWQACTTRSASRYCRWSSPFSAAGSNQHHSPPRPPAASAPTRHAPRQRMQPLGVLLPKRGLQAGQRHGGQLAHCLNAQLGFDLPAGQEGKLEGRLTREGNTAGWLVGKQRSSAVHAHAVTCAGACPPAPHSPAPQTSLPAP